MGTARRNDQRETLLRGGGGGGDGDGDRGRDGDGDGDGDGGDENSNEEQERELLCGFDPSTYNSLLIVTFLSNQTLVPLNLTDANETDVVEAIIEDTYNDIANRLCDPLVRRIFEARLGFTGPITTRRLVHERTTGHRSLQLISASTQQRQSFLFNVASTCRNCDADTTMLFSALPTSAGGTSGAGAGGTSGIGSTIGTGTGTGGRDLLLDTFRNENGALVLSNGGMNQLLTLNDRPRNIPNNNIFLRLPQTGGPFGTTEEACNCMPNLANERAPAAEEFFGLFADVIANETEAETERIDRDVTGVLETVEVRRVDCSLATDTEFESVVFVDAIGDPNNISMADLNVLADTFLDSYAVVSAEVCDPIFRVALEATVELIIPGDVQEGDLQVDGSRRRLQSMAPSMAPAGSNVFLNFVPILFRFVIRGRCRGCKRDTVLFDDGFRRKRRRLQQQQQQRKQKQKQRALSFVQDEDTCYCAVDALDGAPEEEDFTVNYDNMLQDLRDSQGLLDNVRTITGTVQVNDNLPSASPTAFPTMTVAPSAPPSTSPSESPKPSPSPSTGPSSYPSRSPTPSFVPSDRPTEYMPPTDSPVPSPSPSSTPSRGFLSTLNLGGN